MPVKPSGVGVMINVIVCALFPQQAERNLSRLAVGMAVEDASHPTGNQAFVCS
jgi:hypothetical protein